MVKQKFVPPAIIHPYRTARFYSQIQSLKRSGSQPTPTVLTSAGMGSARWAKAVLGSAKRYAPMRTNAFRLIGLYHWLSGEQKASAQWWTLAIREGERLSARPELARTYFEVGKRLQEPGSRYRELDGLGAKEYLDKAEKLFREMDLQQGREQLEQVRAKKGLVNQINLADHYTVREKTQP